MGSVSIYDKKKNDLFAACKTHPSWNFGTCSESFSPFSTYSIIYTLFIFLVCSVALFLSLGYTISLAIEMVSKVPGLQATIPNSSGNPYQIKQLDSFTFIPTRDYCKETYARQYLTNKYKLWNCVIGGIWFYFFSYLAWSTLLFLLAFFLFRLRIFQFVCSFWAP